MSLLLKDPTGKGIDSLEEMMKSGNVPELSDSYDYISPKSRRGKNRYGNCFSNVLQTFVCPIELIMFECDKGSREERLPTKLEILSK